MRHIEASQVAVTSIFGGRSTFLSATRRACTLQPLNLRSILNINRAVKLDVKGFSRANDEFVDIGEGDLPWAEVRKAIDDVGFTGWTTAEVKGGDVERLTLVNKQMRKALGG